MGVADEGEGGKGSKGMNIAFGALAQNYAVEFAVFPGPTVPSCVYSSP